MLLFMSRKLPTSRCIANKRGACSAASPNVASFQFSDLPDDIQQKIKEQSLEGTYDRCSYCGTIWTTYYDPYWKVVKEKEIGTREVGWGDTMIWFI
jgi:hypothetical protein